MKFLEPDDCFNAYYTQKLKLYATIKRLEQTAPSKANIDSKTNSKCNYMKLNNLLSKNQLFRIFFRYNKKYNFKMYNESIFCLQCLCVFH